MQRAWIRRLAAAWVIAAAVPAAAADGSPEISGSLGWFDVVQQRHDALEGRIEYRHSPVLWLIRPFVGAGATTDASAHLYAGLMLDVPIGEHFYVAPSFAPGIWFKGDGRDLGGPIEFRSQIEVGYRFDSGIRLAVSFDHISNADIYEHNPGAESLMATVVVPLQGFW